jgi:hypothetical protein
VAVPPPGPELHLCQYDLAVQEASGFTPLPSLATATAVRKGRASRGCGSAPVPPPVPERRWHRCHCSTPEASAPHAPLYRHCCLRTRRLRYVRLSFCSSAAARARAPSSPIPLTYSRGVSAPMPLCHRCYRRTRRSSVVRVPFSCKASARAHAPSDPIPLFCSKGISAMPTFPSAVADAQ